MYLEDCAFIVFIWSQYDGGDNDKEQWLRFPPKPNEAKLNIVLVYKIVYFHDHCSHSPKLQSLRE